MSDALTYGFMDELEKLAAEQKPQQQQIMGPPTPTQMENTMLNDQLQNLQLRLQLKQMQQQLSAQEQQEAMQARMQAEQAQQAELAAQQSQAPDALPQGAGGAPQGPIDPREMVGG